MHVFSAASRRAGLQFFAALMLGNKFISKGIFFHNEKSTWGGMNPSSNHFSYSFDHTNSVGRGNISDAGKK